MATSIAPSVTYFANKEMKYDELLLERGELFQPLGKPNDDALVRIGYLVKVEELYPSGCEIAKCVRCNKLFVDQSYKAMHDSICSAMEIELDVDIEPVALPGETTEEL
jgi:hypothetical protein